MRCSMLCMCRISSGQPKTGPDSSRAQPLFVTGYGCCRIGRSALLPRPTKPAARTPPLRVSARGQAYVLEGADQGVAPHHAHHVLYVGPAALGVAAQAGGESNRVEGSPCGALCSPQAAQLGIGVAAVEI